MWPFSKRCEHYYTRDEFTDLHRGADGELYFRHFTICMNCGERWYSAPRIPDIITEVIDASLCASTLQKKEPRHE